MLPKVGELLPVRALSRAGAMRDSPPWAADAYPAELCEADAQASGLEYEALHDQVTELCERIRCGDEPPGSPAARLEGGASVLDRARALAGVLPAPTTGPPHVAPGTPWGRTPRSPAPAPTPTPGAAADGD